MKAIVLVIDGCGAGSLGPYGCTWIDTPTFNQLSARSTVFDWAYQDSTDLSRIYTSYWSGQHALATPNGNLSLPRLLKDQQVRSCLLTDDPLVARHRLANDFTERVLLESHETDPQIAREVDETWLADMLAAATAQIQQHGDHGLTWIHARGLLGLWDAPLSMRTKYLGEDESDAGYDLMTPPNHKLATDHDPDELLACTHTYAAQIQVLDFCLDVFFNQLRAASLLDDALVLIMGARGFAVGEHGYVGTSGQLYEEQTHVPLLMLTPDQQSHRDSAFVQPPDLFATLAQWFNVTPPSCWGRDLRTNDSATCNQAFSISDDYAALRTPAWFWQQKRNTEDSAQLFIKPDDHWEVNEVSNRCHDILEAMENAWNTGRQAATANDRQQLGELPDELVNYRL